VIRLLGVEVLRLRSRRLVKIVVSLLVVILAITSIAIFLTHTVDATRPQKAFDMRDELDGLLTVFGVFSGIAMFLIGASAAGAEWAAGTMQSLFYWEPRRVRVMIAKVSALLVAATVVVLVVESLVVLVAYAVGSTKGTTDGLTGGFWTSLLLLLVRAGAFAWFAAVAGFAIAFGTRNTGAALGAAFVYFIGEQFVINWKLWLAPWSLTGAFVGWLSGGSEGPGGEGNGPRIVMGDSGWRMLAYAAVAVAVATLWMRQRDLT
jgi:ABC-type transport system involved in multi-copper enzyme maturation permease subunit